MNYFTNAFNSGNGDEFHLENVKGMELSGYELSFNLLGGLRSLG